MNLEQTQATALSSGAGCSPVWPSASPSLGHLAETYPGTATKNAIRCRGAVGLSCSQKSVMMWQHGKEELLHWDLFGITSHYHRAA